MSINSQPWVAASSRSRCDAGYGLTPLDVLKDLADQGRILDTGNHPKFAAALRAGLYVDGEDTFETLPSIHGGSRFVAVYCTPWLAWHDAVAVFEVRCKHPVETGEVQTWAWHQGRQPGDEIQRFQHDVGRTVPERLLVVVNDPPLAIDRQAFGSDGWARDVSA